MRTQYIPGYQGRIFRTDKTHLLIIFMGGAEKWLGPWPDMSWDTLYDRYMPRFLNLTEQHTKIPMIQLGPKIDLCRGPIIGGHYGEFQYLVSTNQFDDAQKLIIKPQCERTTNYQCCSFECWYLSEKQFITDDIKYAIHHRLDHTADLEKLRRFEQAFVFLKNRWAKYHQQWTT